MSCVYAVCIDEMSEELYREIYQRMPKDRQNRTSRYKHHTDQMRSVAAYYALERALICYSPAAQDVEKLQIGYEASGKPYLKGFHEFHFSLSHAGKYAICAVNWENSIGADILQIRRADLRVAKRFFAKTELDQLMQLQQGIKQDRLFTRIWTRKESYVKFTGEGLNRELSEFNMDLNSKKLMIKSQIMPVQFWEMEEPEGYMISICCKAGITNNIQYHKVQTDHS